MNSYMKSNIRVTRHFLSKIKLNVRIFKNSIENISSSFMDVRIHKLLCKLMDSFHVTSQKHNISINDQRYLSTFTIFFYLFQEFYLSINKYTSWKTNELDERKKYTSSYAHIDDLANTLIKNLQIMFQTLLR